MEGTEDAYYSPNRSPPRVLTVTSSTKVHPRCVEPQCPQMQGITQASGYTAMPGGYESFEQQLVAGSASRGDSELQPRERNIQEQANNESLMEWFDRAVESELRKRKEDSPSSPKSPTRSRLTSPHVDPRLIHSGTSGLDITSKMRSGQDTELLDAVDKLAKAEAMCVFAGAVKAAEMAAAAAPPEYAEEAAAAGARGFQAEVATFQQSIPDGHRPVEVIGYVGITRPKRPKKPGTHAYN